MSWVHAGSPYTPSNGAASGTQRSAPSLANRNRQCSDERAASTYSPENWRNPSLKVHARGLRRVAPGSEEAWSSENAESGTSAPMVTPVDESALHTWVVLLSRKMGVAAPAS